MAKKMGCETEIPGLGATVGDFWSWAYSDVLNNTNRAVFAEFVVGTALGVTSSPRIQWDAFDLFYEGKKVEVKSAAYVQGWEQNGPSRISFDVAERVNAWDSATGTYGPAPGHSADCYVFCLYAEKTDRSAKFLLDMGRWQFYVVPTERIKRRLGSQKTAALSTIERLAEPVGPVCFDQIEGRVIAALGVENVGGQRA